MKKLALKAQAETGDDSVTQRFVRSAGTHYQRHKGWWNSGFGAALLVGFITVWPVPQLWSVLSEKWKETTADHWKIIRLENTVSNLVQQENNTTEVGKNSSKDSLTTATN
ncbi:MAG: hypothetical protein KGL39_47985 [Patescibacteria group bacterium]|nr:hypothetical protein [Patescibacteria group bacterium]